MLLGRLGLEKARIPHADRHGLVWLERGRLEVAMRSAAAIAVASVGAIPQLGFVHEDSGQAFVLDIADLYRHDVTLEIAFGAAKAADNGQPLERMVRQRAARIFRQKKIIPSMIDNIKSLLGRKTREEI